MTSLRRIASIRAALDQHNSDCTQPAKAILLHPEDHKAVGIDELWGVPVVADDRCRVGFLRVDCSGSAWQIEAELAAHLGDHADGHPEPQRVRQLRASAPTG
jgi:hypothetical protein